MSVCLQGGRKGLHSTLREWTSSHFDLCMLRRHDTNKRLRTLQHCEHMAPRGALPPSPPSSVRVSQAFNSQREKAEKAPSIIPSAHPFRVYWNVLESWSSLHIPGRYRNLEKTRGALKRVLGGVQLGARRILAAVDVDVKQRPRVPLLPTNSPDVGQNLQKTTLEKPFKVRPPSEAWRSQHGQAGSHAGERVLLAVAPLVREPASPPQWTE